jgi:hypothetical protein
MQRTHPLRNYDTSFLQGTSAENDQLEIYVHSTGSDLNAIDSHEVNFEGYLLGYFQLPCDIA